MKCPVCNNDLVEVTRSGVAIDVCRTCRGIWLDRGELEKLIALEIDAVPEAANSTQSCRDEQPVPERARNYDHHDHDHDDDDHEHGHERDHGHDYDRGERRFPDERPSGGHNAPRTQHRRGSWIANILEGIGGGGD
jgi:uncharacterized protein